MGMPKLRTLRNIWTSLNLNLSSLESQRKPLLCCLIFLGLWAGNFSINPILRELELWKASSKLLHIEPLHITYSMSYLWYSLILKFRSNVISQRPFTISIDWYQMHSQEVEQSCMIVLLKLLSNYQNSI